MDLKASADNWRFRAKRCQLRPSARKAGLLSVPFIDAGEVTIKGNTTITADDVILASG